MRAPKNTDKLMILKEDAKYFEFKRNLKLQAKAHHVFFVVDPNFDTNTLTASDDAELWDKQKIYINIIFKSHLKTDASITISDFMGNIVEIYQSH